MYLKDPRYVNLVLLPSDSTINDFANIAIAVRLHQENSPTVNVPFIAICGKWLHYFSICLALDPNNPTHI